MPSFDLITGQKRIAVNVVGGQVVKTPGTKLSEELLQSYDNANRKEWGRQAMEDDAFRNGMQWDTTAQAELQERQQMPIVVNVIHPAVEQAKAMLTANRPRFSATAREDSDTRTARMFADLLTWIWDISLGAIQTKQAIDDYYVRGLGVLYTYFDPQLDFNNGEVCFSSLDPFDVFVDPSSKDQLWRDAAHILICRIMSREQVERWMPELSQSLDYAVKSSSTRHPVIERAGLEGQVISGNQALNPEGEFYEIIDRYSRIKKTHYKSIDGTTNRETIFNDLAELQEYAQRTAIVSYNQESGEQIVTDMDKAAELLKLYEETGGTFHYATDPASGQPVMIPGSAASDENAIAGSETTLQPVPFQALIEEGILEIQPILTDRIFRHLSVGGLEAYQGELPIEDYPIIPLPNRFNRNPYPQSDVRFVRGIQEYINKVRSLIVAHAANSANVKAFIPRGSVNKQELEREWAKAGSGLIEYDPEFGVPIIAAPPPLPNELYKNESDARKDIQEILGIYALQQGDSSQAPNTYKGTVAMDEYGQRRIKSKKDDIEQSLNQLARVLIQMIQFFYTKPKVIRILEPNHPPKEVPINQLIYNDVKDVVGVLNDVTVGRYDAVVVSGSMLPANRWARFEYYMELYKLGIIDQVEVLKQTEVVDIEGVLTRFSELQALRQQLAAASEQIKQLSGDLQTAQRESVHANQRVEVEKFKTGLKGVQNRAEKSAELFEARLQDQLKNQKQTSDQE